MTPTFILAGPFTEIERPLPTGNFAPIDPWHLLWSLVAAILILCVCALVVRWSRRRAIQRSAHTADHPTPHATPMSAPAGGGEGSGDESAQH